MSKEWQGQKFVAESIDGTTCCIVADAYFVVANVSDLSAIINGNASTDLPQDLRWTIDVERLQELQSKFSFSLAVNEESIIRIRPWHWLDELPYKVHTQRELVLMRQGIKPLAVFQVETSTKPETFVFPEELFDQHVAQKQFVKYEVIMDHAPADGRTQHAVIRTVFYALRKEAWRINAFILLQRVAAKVRWNDGFERMEGALFGYSDRECDEYFSLMNKNKIPRLWS